MYQLEPLLLENMILHIVKDIQTLQCYENVHLNWMNQLFNAIKNKQFPFGKLSPDLYDLYKVFIINDILSNIKNNNQLDLIDYHFIKNNYFV